MSVDNQSEALRAQYREILRFVRRRVETPADAEDLAQEAFANAVASLARSADAAPATLGWLYTVARRRVIDAARRKRLQTVPLELVENVEGRDEAGYGVSVARALSAALATLSETNRRVVVLRLLDSRSFTDIAAELGLSEEATRMRFMRALRELRTELEREGVAP